jgi:dTDP-glucose 4,6-dehydratase
VSTDEVYGSLAPNQFASERTAYDPRSPYAASKASADHLVAAWYNTYGLPVLITNSSNNYGPFQFPEKLIPLLTLNALTGRPLPIYGDGNQERDWLYVDDHANALIHVLEKGQVGQTYNIGSRTVLRNIEVVIKLCDILDKLMPAKHSHRRLIKFVPDRPGHDLRYAIDPKTIEADLGWKPKEAFDAGLQKTITWYLENEWWWRPLREEVYDGERLGINRSVNRE